MPERSRIISLKDFKEQTKAGPVDGLVLSKQFTTEVKAPEGEDRILLFTISTPAVDRDGDSIEPTGWDLSNYNRNPVVLWAHDYDEPPVGKSLATWVEGKALKSRAEFVPKEINPFAYMIYEMYKGGFMNATSVGFIPQKYMFNETRDSGGYFMPVDFLEQELLEYSCVPVPSNPEALQNAKSKGIDMDPMRVWAEKILDGQPSEKGLWVPRKTVEQIHGLLKADKFISVPSGAQKAAPAAADPSPAAPAQPAPEAAPPAIEPEAKNAAPKPVLVETRTVPVEVWKCPHCQEEIGEKGLYTKDLQTYVHRSCGGAITFPASSPGGQAEPVAEKGGATVKAGAVLSKANKDLLGQAKTLIDQVLASTEPGDPPDEPDVVQDGAPPPTTKTPNMEPPAPTEEIPGGAVALPGIKSGMDPATPGGPFLEIADTPSSLEATIEVDEKFAKALQEAVKSEIQERMLLLTGRVD